MVWSGRDAPGNPRQRASLAAARLSPVAYADKVLAEHARLQAVAGLRAVPLPAPQPLRTLAPVEAPPAKHADAAAPAV